MCVEPLYRYSGGYPSGLSVTPVSSIVAIYTPVIRNYKSTIYVLSLTTLETSYTLSG